MLLVADTGRIDIGAVSRAVRLVRSTSPSALLMASLDAARRQLAVHGEELLDRTIRAAARTRAAIEDIPGATIVGEQLVGLLGIAGWDPLRIVIDVRGTGFSGYQVAEALRASYDTHLELATQATVVLVLGVAQPVEPLDRFAHDLADAIGRITSDSGPAGPESRLSALAHPRGGSVVDSSVPPRDAFLGASEAVPVGEAVGRISTEAVAGYPPGVPTLLPGEVVTDAVVSYLREMVAAGARLHGAADPSFATLRVMV
jgi:lysine decarboxylase